MILPCQTTRGLSSSSGNVHTDSNSCSWRYCAHWYCVLKYGCRMTTAYFLYAGDFVGRDRPEYLEIDVSPIKLNKAVKEIFMWSSCRFLCILTHYGVFLRVCVFYVCFRVCFIPKTLVLAEGHADGRHHTGSIFTLILSGLAKRSNCTNIEDNRGLCVKMKLIIQTEPVVWHLADTTGAKATCSLMAVKVTWAVRVISALSVTLP